MNARHHPAVAPIIAASLLILLLAAALSALFTQEPMREWPTTSELGRLPAQTPLACREFRLSPLSEPAIGEARESSPLSHPLASPHSLTRCYGRGSIPRDATWAPLIHSPSISAAPFIVRRPTLWSLDRAMSASPDPLARMGTCLSRSVKANSVHPLAGFDWHLWEPSFFCREVLV